MSRTDFGRSRGAKSPAEFERHKALVMQQFEVDQDRNVLVNRSLAEYWGTAQAKSECFKEAGERGAKKRWGQKGRDGLPMALPSPGNSKTEEEVDVDGEVKQTNDTEKDSCLLRVWHYYLEKLNRDPTFNSFTDSRQQVGLARLNDCLLKSGGDLAKAEQLLCYAIDRLAESGFHNGKNDRNAKYLDWDKYLFSTLEKLEGWLQHEPQ
jgi:hypothetical protein